MAAQPDDEVELIRILAAPFAGDLDLRDAIEMMINGERLSELLGGLPLDASEVRAGLVDTWLWGGTDVVVGRCACRPISSGSGLTLSLTQSRVSAGSFNPRTRLTSWAIRLSLAKRVRGREPPSGVP